VAQILSAIYEADFLPCNRGYRPERGAQQAARELAEVLTKGRIEFVVEVDIKGYFEHLQHPWLLKMLALRIADGALLGLIAKWLKAGILEEDGQIVHPVTGTPQGGSVSPVLANVYLHYVLDLWFEHKVRKVNHGQSTSSAMRMILFAGLLIDTKRSGLSGSFRSALSRSDWKWPRTRRGCCVLGGVEDRTTDGSTFWASSSTGGSVAEADRWCNVARRTSDCARVWPLSPNGSGAAGTESCRKSCTPWPASTAAIGIIMESGAIPRAWSNSSNRPARFYSNG
jgi:hypothetical protein